MKMFQMKSLNDSSSCANKGAFSEPLPVAQKRTNFWKLLPNGCCCALRIGDGKSTVSDNLRSHVSKSGQSEFSKVFSEWVNTVQRYLSKIALAAVCVTAFPVCGNAEPEELTWNDIRNRAKGLSEALENTDLYLLVSSYCQAKKYAWSVVKSLQANVDTLEKYGVHTKIIVCCDGTDDSKSSYPEQEISCYKAALEGLNKFYTINEKGEIVFREVQGGGLSSLSEWDGRSSMWELVGNERNFGCSKTRYASLKAIKGEAVSLEKQGRNVYIGIFDGDDAVHSEYFFLLLVNALHTGADISNWNGNSGVHREKKVNGEVVGQWIPYREDIAEWKPSGASDENSGRLWFVDGREGACACGPYDDREDSGKCCTTKIFKADYLYKRLSEIDSDSCNKTLPALPSGLQGKINLGSWLAILVHHIPNMVKTLFPEGFPLKDLKNYITDITVDQFTGKLAKYLTAIGIPSDAQKPFVSWWLCSGYEGIRPEKLPPLGSLEPLNGLRGNFCTCMMKYDLFYYSFENLDCRSAMKDKDADKYKPKGLD